MQSAAWNLCKTNPKKAETHHVSALYIPPFWDFCHYLVIILGKLSVIPIVLAIFMAISALSGSNRRNKPKLVCRLKQIQAHHFQ